MYTSAHNMYFPECTQPTFQKKKINAWTNVCHLYNLWVKTMEKLFWDMGNSVRNIPDENTYFINQQAFCSGDTLRTQENKSSKMILFLEKNSLLNLPITPGLHFKNTFICKLIAFILLVSAFIFFFFLGISTRYFVVCISSKSKLFSYKERHLWQLCWLLQ